MTDEASSHGEDQADPGREPIDLERKVDIIAGAVADLEGRMAQVAGELASLGPKLNELLDRHPAGLGAASDTTAAVAADVATTALEPVHTGLAALDAAAAATRDEVLRTMDAVERVATAVHHLDERTDDRLAAVRDAAMAPVADLQALLAARGDRLDGRIEELTTALQALRDDMADDGRAALLDAVEELGASLRTLTERSSHSDVRPLTERVDDLAAAVQSLTWQLPELSAEVAGLRAAADETAAAVAADVAASDDWADGDASAATLAGEPDEWADRHPGTPATLAVSGDELVGQIADRMETALAGLLRLIDERLASLRMAAAAGTPPPPAGVGSFEAGAVMGAVQAAWTRLEQRLDAEFDDLSRQLQAMAAMIEQATARAEAAANRPVVTGDQLRQAASTVRDSVLKASRARRDRRGGPKGLGTGS